MFKSKIKLRLAMECRDFIFDFLNNELTTKIRELEEGILKYIESELCISSLYIKKNEITDFPDNLTLKYDLNETISRISKYIKESVLPQLKKFIDDKKVSVYKKIKNKPDFDENIFQFNWNNIFHGVEKTILEIDFNEIKNDLLSKLRPLGIEVILKTDIDKIYSVEIERIYKNAQAYYYNNFIDEKNPKNIGRFIISDVTLKLKFRSLENIFNFNKNLEQAFIKHYKEYFSAKQKELLDIYTKQKIVFSKDKFNHMWNNKYKEFCKHLHDILNNCSLSFIKKFFNNEECRSEKINKLKL